MTAALLFLLLFGLALLIWPASDEQETVEGIPARHTQEQAVAEYARKRAQAGSVDFWQNEGNPGGDPPGWDKWQAKYGIDYIPATVTYSEYLHDVEMD